MSKANKFADIIERIEYLRNLLNLNKSRFSSEIGMKPQTYNNFIGAQGSKPNVELITGIVNQYGVNPMWLLNGTGAVFMDESKSAAYLSRSPAYRTGGAVFEARASIPEAPSQADLEALRAELKQAEPILRQAESTLQQFEQGRLNALERGTRLVQRFYEVDPAKTVAELRAMLERLQQHLAKHD